MAHTMNPAARAPALYERLDGVVAAANEIILGKETQIRLALTCLIARGHLLIEDLPGLGKTTLAHVLAQLLGLRFNRIQFTSDMLPADVLGVSVYERSSGGFQFHPGPIFTQLLLADEVNRATPKAQSALLEAMEERQVTVEGETRVLPDPFFVIATQNPLHQVGTFPLPESQLDRFLMCIGMGYPDAAAERALLRGADRRELLDGAATCLPADDLKRIQAAARDVYVSDPLLDYLQDLLAFSRDSGRYHAGLSPRAGLALLRTAQAWALMAGRDHVEPEDIQAVAPAVVSHRLRAVAETAEMRAEDVAHDLLRSVPLS